MTSADLVVLLTDVYSLAWVPGAVWALVGWMVVASVFALTLCRAIKNADGWAEEEPRAGLDLEWLVFDALHGERQ